MPVVIDLRTSQWRCDDPQCAQRIFAERLPSLAVAYARTSERLAEATRVLGHAAGGRPGERLAHRLGLAVSRDTVLRHLKRSASRSGGKSHLRVVGIDDWAWRKGHSYGTIVVDLERRKVIDVLPDRSAASAKAWLTAQGEQRRSSIFNNDRDIPF